MPTVKLSSMPYAKANVLRFNSGAAELVSYNTTAAILDADGWLVITCLCSATTRRHVGAFMKEYCNSDYQMAKALYKDDLTMNIYTGEVRDLRGEW